MRPIRYMTGVHIDITNQCTKSCCNCTRFSGHYTNNRIYFLEIEYIEDILKTLTNFPGMACIMGGEPTLHPKFNEILELFKKYRTIHRMALFTNNPDSLKYKDVYFFENNIILNTHTGYVDKHTPLLTSSEWIKSKYNIDQKIIDNYIQNCWIQTIWAANINPKGAFFCEVAGMLSYLFNGPSGINIYDHPDWWKYDLDVYQYQIDWACKKCGGAMPLKSKESDCQIDDISDDNLEELKKLESPKIKANKYKIYDCGFLQNSEYRGWLWNWQK